MNADDVFFGLEYDEYDKYMWGLAKLRLSGMTYKAIGSMTGLSHHMLARRLKPFEKNYIQECDKNFKILKDSLTQTDSEYDFMTDPRTVSQQMCALLMGGEEVRSTLEQLSNWRNHE